MSDGFWWFLPCPGLPPQLALLANHPQHSAKRGLVLWVVRKYRRQARTEQNSEKRREVYLVGEWVSVVGDLMRIEQGAEGPKECSVTVRERGLW